MNYSIKATIFHIKTKVGTRDVDILLKDSHVVGLLPIQSNALMIFLSLSP